MKLLLKKQYFRLIVGLLFLIPELSSQIITTISGNGIAGYNGDGGLSTLASINNPRTMVFDAAGNMYIADYGNNCIRKVNTSGVITTVAGTGTSGFSGDGGQATLAKLNGPKGITIDPAGNLYISDSYNMRIRKVNTAGIISTIAGNGTTGYSGDGGQATLARLNYPERVILDATGNIYIADYYNNCIRKISTSGIITTIAGTGAGGYSGDGGQASLAKLNQPVEVTIDPFGNLYVSDYLNNCVRKIATNGIITTIAGNGTAGYSGDGGQANSAQLNGPYGVSFDCEGNIYIADNGNNRVRKVNAAGVITSIAGNGMAGYSGDGGQAQLAKLKSPTGVAFDGAGNLYISDYLNSRIRKVSTLWTGTLSINSPTICAGETATLTTSGATTYTWNTGNTTNSITVTPTVTSNYTVNGTTYGGCKSTGTVEVTISCVITPTVTPICSGTLGAPVFFEDFGSGPLYGPPLSPGITNYPYQTGVPGNGTYVISSSSNPSSTNAGYVNDNDHTGNTNGYMMVVNSDFAATEVYRRHVTGLCPGTTYAFSAYLANNNSPDAVSNVCASGYVYANIKFQTEYPVGTVINSITSGNLAVATNSTVLPWIQYGFAFTTAPGQTSVDVVLKNNAPGGCGNDYVLDDISLSPCGPGIVLNIAPNQTIFCVGDNIQLQSSFSSGSYVNPQYQWQYSDDGGLTWSDINGATSSNYNISSVISSQRGMYQLIIAENGNINLPSCRIVAGPIAFSVAGSIAVNTASTTICAGNSVVLSATGATTYTWSNGVISNSITINPSVTNSYSVIGAAGTCTSQAVSTVSVISNPTVVITPTLSIICFGQTITLTSSGADTYNWINASSLSNPTSSNVIASPITTTVYSVTGLSNGCTHTAVTTVSVLPNPSITLSPDIIICQGTNSSATLIANGASSYSWTNSSSLSSSTGSLVVASPNSTTIYTVSGLTSSCSNTAVVTVSVNPSPIITSMVVNNTSCGLANGSVIINSSPFNNTYVWSQGVSSTTNTANNLAAGNYSIVIKNATCQTSTVIAISSSIPLLITATTITPSNCNTNTGSITITDNLSNSIYNWSPGITSTLNMINNLASGSYSLTITNGACTTSSVFPLGFVSEPVAAITTDPPICNNNDGIFIIDSITGGTFPYLTNFNNTGYTNNMVFEQLSQGTYTLEIIDSNNCKTNYILKMPAKNGDYTLYVPNTFTPNNDKVNDIWYVQGTCLSTFHCFIYNRWGEKIIELEDIAEGWDGMYNGKSVPDGVYLYLLEVETINGAINKTGHITLFR